MSDLLKEAIADAKAVREKQHFKMPRWL